MRVSFCLRRFALALCVLGGAPMCSRLCDRICISPQCGFASHSEGNPVNEDQMRAKLSLVVQTAKKIWKDA